MSLVSQFSSGGRLAGFVLLVAIWGAGALALPVHGEEGTPGTVYVIPIKGMIEPALLYVVRRGVAEAEAHGARGIVFEMDTPGGTLDAAREIVRIITGLKVPTYTYVEHEALSAGAIIALATKHIYMAPGSVIGDAMPIMMSPLGGVQEPGEGLEEKMVSGVAALIRAAADQGGHDPELAEAMVRREAEYRVGDKIISPSGQLLTLTDREAAQPVPPDGRPLLSEGTADSLETMLEMAGLAGAEVVRLEVTPAERLARWIAMLAPLFLMLGLLGIYVELHTPGFGLPGLLGIGSLAIFFWGHHIAGLAGMEDLAIFLLGVLLLLLEVLVIPGFGITGALGIVFICWGLLAAMIQHYPGTPWYSLPTWDQLMVPVRNFGLGLGATVLGAVVIGRFLPRSRLARTLVLEQSTAREAGFSAVSSNLPAAGTTAVAETPLRPSGTVRVGDRLLDAITEGLYIERGRQVVITGNREGRVIVEPLEHGSSAGGMNE